MSTLFFLKLYSCDNAYMLFFSKDRMLLDRIESFLITLLKLAAAAWSQAKKRVGGIVCLNRSNGFDIATLFQRVAWAVKETEVDLNDSVIDMLVLLSLFLS